MSKAKTQVFPKKALFKYLNKDLIDNLGEDAEADDRDIPLACKKHLQEKGYLPSEWEAFLKQKLNNKE